MLATLVAFSALTAAFIVAYPLLRGVGARGFWVLAAAPAIAFGAFVTLLPEVLAGGVIRLRAEWVPQYELNLSFNIDLFALALALLVTGAGVLVLLYCARYFRSDDSSVPRFGLVFILFAASMLGLVVADNVFLMFIFWEATTVLSFLLIGHNGKRRASRAAALQAIIVTTLGGLAMLIGLLILVAVTGESDLSAILDAAPQGTAVTVAVYLLLAGALSKSAIFPFHFWLPQAMAAPTPVSAYLHAAAMVKAGIYLIARLSPVFGDVPGYRVVLVSLGAATMLLGALRALRKYDLKLILAFGTVSQLGMLTMLFGLARPAVSAAATALLFGHALAKAPLFLTVGMIEHRTGTRDLRKISGLGRQAPVLAVTASIAGLSMIGFPPLFGFVAKEAALTELFAEPFTGVTVAALTVLIVGSVLTAAYTIRFLLGAFTNKQAVSAVPAVSKQYPDMLIAPATFALLTFIAGIFVAALDDAYRGIRPGGEQAEHLALWHGFTPALYSSIAILALSVAVLFVVGVTRSRLFKGDKKYSASAAYFAGIRMLDVFAVRVTGLTQRGSLPYYLAVILVVAAGTIIASLIYGAQPLAAATLGTPQQLVVAVIIIVSAVGTLFAKKRFQSVILVGFVGYAMAMLFALHGAPDLALTQMLVETITLIAFVLVIRRLPQHLASRNRPGLKVLQLTIGTTLALAIGVLALTTIAARSAEPISLAFPELAVSGGHGHNVVNVTLVDIRGWDTFGELSVVVAAATGIASLVFLSARSDDLPKIRRRESKKEVLQYLRRVADPNDPLDRGIWMLAGHDLSPERRSIILEVVVRIIFHALIVLSIYMLLAGHNSPGGGFAGGLIAGIALVARYLAGGRSELGATVPFDAGKIVGLGMSIAILATAAPMLFGQPALSSSWIDLDLGVFGELPLVSSTVFDIGVYFVVFGLVLDVLRTLGSQIDVHTETERQEAEQ